MKLLGPLPNAVSSKKKGGRAEDAHDFFFFTLFRFLFWLLVVALRFPTPRRALPFPFPFSFFLSSPVRLFWPSSSGIAVSLFCHVHVFGGGCVQPAILFACFFALRAYRC
ncbi:hypothetical protein DFJ73DRAFT_566702 [Zopfochytrium polystomum]|nr:hypothetical protein DFJ73DRAFT_566702 [Zopfochytrium polystomum]